ncbi:MAG: VOC family protein [Thermodesulfovibrionales bacterium]
MVKGMYGFNIVVKDLKSATERYEKVFGMKSTHLSESDFAFPGLNGSLFIVGGLKIHLITSLTDDTAVAKFLANKGEGLFLISLDVDNLEQEMARMKEGGAIFVSEKPFTGSFGKVNFIHPKSMNGVQVEVLEQKK